LLSALAILISTKANAFAGPSASATSAFNAYASKLDTRLAEQHRNASGFLPGLNSDSEARLKRGETIIEKLSPEDSEAPPGAMLHHWRGTVFVPGARAEAFEKILRNFDAYPKYFAPQVVQAAILNRQGDRIQVKMRVRQKHVITVVMDTAYDVSFARLDDSHRDSASRSTHITEIDAAGTSSERELSDAEAHGFLWRLNTYWSYEERDGGLYMQVESISLTRGVPHGLGWIVGPFVESVPRESLEFTLQSVCAAVRRG
jgi:hypothetical protein